MRFFPLLDFQYMVLALFLGVIGVLLVYVAWAGYSYSSRKEEEPIEQFEIGTDHEVTKKPVPPFLILVYVGITIWALAYALMVGIFGGPIG